MFLTSVCFYFGLSIVFVYCKVDEDYFFRSTESKIFRREKDCDPKSQLQCLNVCKTDTFRCFDNQCFCQHTFILLQAGRSVDDPNTIGELAIYKIQRPGLRHHIAHFCPNLEDARKCIRKCVKVGKPAFCGKDHECYCGHRYSSHDKNVEGDALDIYANFQDLYEKYFGPRKKDVVIKKDDKV